MKFKKVIIVGTTCTGKSTLGKQIAEITNVKWFDLDDFHWLPNWVEKSKPEMRADVRETILPNENWIVSGNYSSTVNTVLWTEADTIIWLNYNLSTIIWRWFKRTIKRVYTKEKVCNGNVETFYMAFLNLENNLLFWIFRTYKMRRKTYSKWKKEDFKHLDWIVLHHQKETNNYLKHLNENVL